MTKLDQNHGKLRSGIGGVGGGGSLAWAYKPGGGQGGNCPPKFGQNSKENSDKARRNWYLCFYLCKISGKSPPLPPLTKESPYRPCSLGMFSKYHVGAFIQDGAVITENRVCISISIINLFIYLFIYLSTP